MTPHRWLPALAGAAMVLAGCADRPGDELNDRLAERETEVASCEASACADELAALARALGGLPGVVEVAQARYREEQGTAGARVVGALVVDPGVRCDRLEEQAAELAWRSSVSPLAALHLDCGTPGTDPAQRDAGYVGTPVRPTSAAQLDAWGDRGTLPPG
ncbi:hypothetical protein ACJ5H2_04875 [Nocardioides sp. R1-1]|uniref:hypothetical protein n=1 Tax=Nocardioides sp. R1-1 TaxID=3383502 RepID=UPI0038D0C333